MNNGNITLDFSKINDMFKTFYSQLYTSELPQESTLMDNFLTLWTFLRFPLIVKIDYTNP